MTMKELLTSFECFYGEKYSGVFLQTMTEYLAGFSPRYYPAIYAVMVKRVSRAFSKSPGPAEIEQHKNEIIDSVPRPVYLPEPAEEEFYTENLFERFINLRREKAQEV